MKPPTASLIESFGPSLADLGAGKKSEDVESKVSDIHSLYQDLFITDIKHEVEVAQSELKDCRTQSNHASIDLKKLKK